MISLFHWISMRTGHLPTIQLGFWRPKATSTIVKQRFGYRQMCVIQISGYFMNISNLESVTLITYSLLCELPTWTFDTFTRFNVFSFCTNALQRLWKYSAKNVTSDTKKSLKRHQKIIAACVHFKNPPWIFATLQNSFVHFDWFY